jgi:hypothetical protein
MTNFDFTFAPDEFVTIEKTDTRQTTRKRRLDGRSARAEGCNRRWSVGSRRVIRSNESNGDAAGIEFERKFRDCGVDLDHLNCSSSQNIDGTGGPMGMMRRECYERWNSLGLGKVRMEDRSLCIVRTGTVHVEQRSIHKADQDSGNGIGCGDSSNGGTISLDRPATNFLPPQIAQSRSVSARSLNNGYAARAAAIDLPRLNSEVALAVER